MNKEQCPRCNGTGKERLFEDRLCVCYTGFVDSDTMWCQECSHKSSTHNGGYCYHEKFGIDLYDKPKINGKYQKEFKHHNNECSEESSGGGFICGCIPEKPFLTNEQYRKLMRNETISNDDFKMKFCCKQMEIACDWGDDMKGDRTMMEEDDGFYMACSDCATHNMNPVNYCPFCGEKLK